MITSSKVLILVLSLVLLGSCSQDEGDGKEEKGKSNLTAAAVNDFDTSSIRCASNDELRNQCYRDLLKTSPEVISEFKGKNPFLLKTWDQTDFSNSPILKEVTNCQVSFPNLCN